MGIGKILGVIGLIVFLWVAYLGYTLITLTPQIRAEWGYVDENTIELDVTVYFGKSLPISANIKEADLYWAGIKVGTLKDLKIGFLKDSARGVLVLKNREIVEALKEHIRNGEQSDIEIRVSGSLFGIPIIRGSFSQPLKTDLLAYVSNITIESSGDLIKTPAVEGMPSKWGKIDENGIEILSDVKLYNPNPFPLPLFGVKYYIDANGYQVAQGELLEKVIIPANGRGTAKIRTVVDTNILPKVIAEHIKRGERSEVTLKLTLTVKVLNQEIEMPLPEIKKRVETNVIEQLNLAFS
ncbi:LEA type 2 family protein [Thermococcus alcaliphilus]|uniref:LEA type 2 family protein n=1 Tax=Thermococcus alcaliphilus TaxID=139207 RepID=UPI002090A4BF|nr:LEA type 2 family protein [Thermococcus alcaliphilus]MCO6040451.1 LEA type 2 family protein [Thermococcus alcaliphilus]